MSAAACRFNGHIIIIIIVIDVIIITIVRSRYHRSSALSMKATKVDDCNRPTYRKEGLLTLIGRLVASQNQVQLYLLCVCKLRRWQTLIESAMFSMLNCQVAGRVSKKTTQGESN